MFLECVVQKAAVSGTGSHQCFEGTADSILNDEIRKGDDDHVLYGPNERSVY